MAFAMAKLLVGGGARVVITGRSQARLDAARQQPGENATAVQGDVSSLSDLHTLAEHVERELRSLEALFVNAGIARSMREWMAWCDAAGRVPATAGTGGGPRRSRRAIISLGHGRSGGCGRAGECGHCRGSDLEFRPYGLVARMRFDAPG